MSFRRSIVNFARADISPSLEKLWKKHYKVDGQISQHLSPFEQKIMSPMFKDMHTKIFKKLTDFLMEAGPGLGLGIFVYIWADKKYAELAYHHRE